MLLSDVQPLKVFAFISFSSFGKTTEDSFLQYEKADSPIDVTLLGMVTLVRPLQL
jgi:hypothetical protein